MKRSSPVAAVVRLAVVCVAMACSGCGGKTSAQSADAGANVCVVPATADTTDCKTQRAYMVCHGSVVSADGSVTTPDGAPPKCTNECKPTEYSVTCSHFAVPGNSLGCQIIPTLNPQGVLSYCCPCGK